MNYPAFTLDDDGVYSKSNKGKPFWILIVISLLLISLGLLLFFCTDEPYSYLTIGLVLGFMILAGATNKIVIDTKSKKITTSFLFGIVSLKKNGKLYNQYQLIDNYMNGVNIGIQIYLISKENLSKKIYLFGPFLDEPNIEKHTNIAIEIIDKLQSQRNENIF